VAALAGALASGFRPHGALTHDKTARQKN